MGNLQKITKSVAPAVLEEIERTPDIAEKFNPETHYIDSELTHLNYDLTNRNMSALNYLHKRLNEVKVQNRDDVKVLGQWVWTMPKDLDPKYQEQFFQEIYNYHAEKFGAENICYATVHLDERTPHMHLGIIPVVKVDKVRTDGKTEKVCAKDVFNRSYLQHAHADLQIYLEEHLGVEVNLLNGESLGIDGIKNYKVAKDLAKEINTLETMASDLRSEVTELRQERTHLQEQVKELKSERNSIENEIEQKKGLLNKIREFLIGHPNFIEMFLHWLNPEGKEKERQLCAQKYNEHLEDLRSQSRGFDR